MKHRIAVIPGDGIGPEVIEEGIKVLKATAQVVDELEFEFQYFPWGCEYCLKKGKMMPDDGLEKLKGFEAILREGKIRTRDRGGSSKTTEVGDVIAEKIRNLGC